MSATRQVINIDGIFFSLDEILDTGMSGKIFHGTNLDTDEAVAIKKFEFDHDELEAIKKATISAVNASFEESITPVKTSLLNLQAKLALDPDESTQSEIATLEEKLARANTFLPGHIEKAVQNALQTKLDTMRIGAFHEGEMLKKVGDGIGNVSVHEENSDPAATAYYIAMKLAPGEKVTNLLRENKKMDTPAKLLNPDMLFDLGLKLGLSLLRVQTKNIVLRDIHFNNVMYDLPTKKLTLVDYGDALELTNGVAVGHAMGSEPFMAPEILDGLDNRRASAANREYSEKTTVYSYGAMLANLFDLAVIRDSQFFKTKETRFKTIILCNSDTQFSKLADAEIRKRMLLLIEEMTTKNPGRRISLRTATERLHNIISTYKLKQAEMREHSHKRKKLVRETNLSQSTLTLFKKDNDAASHSIPIRPNAIPTSIDAPHITSTAPVASTTRVNKRSR